LFEQQQDQSVARTEPEIARLQAGEMFKIFGLNPSLEFANSAASAGIRLPVAGHTRMTGKSSHCCQSGHCMRCKFSYSENRISWRRIRVWPGRHAQDPHQSFRNTAAGAAPFAEGIGLLHGTADTAKFPARRGGVQWHIWKTGSMSRALRG